MPQAALQPLLTDLLPQSQDNTRLMDKGQVGEAPDTRAAYYAWHLRNEVQWHHQELARQCRWAVSHTHGW